MTPDAPEIFVLAGPNGAGKTTVAEQLLPGALGVDTFVNADFIAGKPPFICSSPFEKNNRPIILSQSPKLLYNPTR